MSRLFIATFCCLLLTAFAFGQCPEKAENCVPVQYVESQVPTLDPSASETKPIVCKIQPYFLEPPDIIQSANKYFVNFLFLFLFFPNTRSFLT